MSDSPEFPPIPKPRLHKEYEDPHFHDEDELPFAEDREPDQIRRPPPRKLPPRPRRFDED
jgi:hypothetical protein